MGDTQSTLNANLDLGAVFPRQTDSECAKKAIKLFPLHAEKKKGKPLVIVMERYVFEKNS